MSSTSGISTSTTNMADFLETIEKKKKGSAAANAASGSSDSSAADSASEAGADFLTSELEKQGYTGSTLSDLQSKIQAAVSSLQNSSSGSTDPQSIHDAVNGVLQQAGVNTDQIDSDFHSAMADGTMGPPPAGGGSETSNTSSTDSSSDIDSLLTKLGVDPTSFKSALQQAISTGQSTGTFDMSKLFSSAAAGSQVDIYA